MSLQNGEIGKDVHFDDHWVKCGFCAKSAVITMVESLVCGDVIVRFIFIGCGTENTFAQSKTLS